MDTGRAGGMRTVTVDSQDDLSSLMNRSYAGSWIPVTDKYRSFHKRFQQEGLCLDEIIQKILVFLS